MYLPSHHQDRAIHEPMFPCVFAGMVLYMLSLATLVNGEINDAPCVIDLQLDKPVYQVGEDLTVTCIVNNMSDQCDLTSAQLYAQIRGDNITRATPLVSPTSAVFRIHNVTERYNNEEIVCLGNGLSARKTLKVGVPPVTPYNIQCIVLNIEHMSCSWEPLEQNLGLETTYRLLYSFHSFQAPTPNTPCPRQEGTNKCFWEEYYRNTVCAIKVIAKNALGERSAKIDFKTENIVKLNPVKRLQSVSSTTDLYVTWEEPIKQHLEQYITYELTILSQWSQTPVSMVNITDDVEKISHTEGGLVPHTTYTVKVRCITNETRDHGPIGRDFWSDTAMIQETTESDVPKSAPVVAIGGYNVKDLQTEVIWQPVPQHQVQGNFSTTRIRAFLRVDSSERPSCDTSDVIKREFEPQGFTATFRLETNRTYDICVDVGNDKGYNDSLSLEAIRKPAYQPSLPAFYAVRYPSEVKVHVLGWNASLDYTVYWCDGLFLRQQCHDQMHFQWMPVTGTVTSLAAAFDVSLVVAMSAEYMEESHDFSVSSGMNFAPYIFTAGKDVQPPSQVKVLTKVSANIEGSLFLEWLKPRHSDTAYIDRFRIAICPVDLCDGTNDTVVEESVREQLDGMPQTYRIRGLIEGHTYNIRMSSVGDNSSSPYTEPIQETVPVTGLQKKYIIIISVCSVIAAFLIAAGIYTIVRYCKDKCKKFLEPIAIEAVPDDVADRYLEQNGNKTSSVDPYVDIDGGRGTANYWSGGKLDIPTAFPPTAPPSAGDFAPVLTNPKNEKTLADRMHDPAVNVALLQKDHRLDSNGLFNNSGQPLLLHS